VRVVFVFDKPKASARFSSYGRDFLFFGGPDNSFSISDEGKDILLSVHKRTGRRINPKHTSFLGWARQNILMMPMSLACSLPGSPSLIRDDLFLPITTAVLNILNQKQDVMFFIFIGECSKHQSMINRHKHGVMCFQTTSQMINSDYLGTIDKFIPDIEWGMVGGTLPNIYDRLSVEHN
jgi:hypothetical protein